MSSPVNSIRPLMRTAVIAATVVFIPGLLATPAQSGDAELQGWQLAHTMQVKKLHKRKKNRQKQQEEVRKNSEKAPLDSGAKKQEDSLNK